MTHPDYLHTQSGKTLVTFLLISGAVPILVLAHLWSRWGLNGRLLSGPLLIVIILWTCSFAFHSLTVRVAGGVVELSFGPGWVRKRFLLAEVSLARPVRNPWIAGWGIHYIGRGWLYNVAGLDAVELVMKDGHRQRIGTDEPVALAAAINAQL